MNFCVYRILFIYMVIRRPVTAADRIQVQHSPCGICGGQLRTGACPPKASVYSCHRASTNAVTLHSFVKQAGKAWEPVSGNIYIYIYIFIHLFTLNFQRELQHYLRTK